MSRPRITIPALMALVLLAGFGFAALRNANALWASAAFTVAMVMVLGASLGALARKGPARMTWAGFAAFGWAHLLLSALSPREVGLLGFGPIRWPNLFTDFAFSIVLPYVVPLGGVFAPAHEQVIYSAQLILFSLVGLVVGRALAVKDERPD